ncbi:hypothetical protein RJT34_08960 [Clitoria ternatea]|uniref:Uncharacterized protein n=1 Tax=Clitoria ternatea TaxID=43366 RepID=A0AAN9K785_CLITE
MENHIKGIRETQSTTTTEWTDEKHSMYIKSIEASFVNQLYDSKQMGVSFSPKGTYNDPATTSGQFKVLRCGRWQKINFERGNPQMSRVNEPQDLTANPWIKHYRSSSKQRSIQESATTASKVIDLCEPDVRHQDLLCSDTEMSDQNFVDEEVKGKRIKRSKVKRHKSAIANEKDSDQMVPNRKSAGRDVAKNYVSAA